ncbi:MAG: hypothetical protein HYW97_00185 [Candidatus Wildermuthbacteria bacterium]|nr:hypothetical protein [Candidatus Wildermuthbacteria bacterium]
MISNYTRHPPNSAEDHNGKDFTVTKMVGNTLFLQSFGVTISMRNWPESVNQHPNIPQFCFPIGTKPETIQKRILKLFND